MHDVSDDHVILFFPLQAKTAGTIISSFALRLCTFLSDTVQNKYQDLSSRLFFHAHIIHILVGIYCLYNISGT